MIATLEGLITEKLADTVVLQCGGLGYGLNVSFEDFGALETGQPAKLYVYEHIRDNAYDLFGFRSLEAKRLFELLLSVNGVGPKMALAILSIASLSHVRQAIAAGDTKFITQANGVGKRVAERVVVDLKDKVGLVGVDLQTTGLLQGEGLLMQDEAVEALVTLGYSAVDAAMALQNIDGSLPAEERIKMALTGTR